MWGWPPGWGCLESGGWTVSRAVALAVWVLLALTILPSQTGTFCVKCQPFSSCLHCWPGADLRLSLGGLVKSPLRTVAGFSLGLLFSLRHASSLCAMGEGPPASVSVSDTGAMVRMTQGSRCPLPKIAEALASWSLSFFVHKMGMSALLRTLR